MAQDTAEIRKVQDKTGAQFFPITHVDAVIDENGSTLSTMLSNKQDTLVSGTSIKTINSTSLLGGGNINIQDGKSAYQIWLEEGNVGTEEDFLASLQGDSGYSGAAGELEVVNSLVTGGTTAALSAEMGKQLNQKITELQNKIVFLTEEEYAELVEPEEGIIYMTYEV